MKLIIGLGNPGEEYENTRHNLGFIIADRIAKDSEVAFSFDKKFNAETAKAKVEGKPVILAKPHTFVNKSGEAARKLKLFYKTKPENMVIIHDDLDIEFGDFKLSFAKDSGGHRGVQNIIDNLKTNKFWRLRIGTANRRLTAARRNPLKAKKEAVGNFVLSKFTPNEQAELKKLIKKAIGRLSNAF